MRTPLRSLGAGALVLLSASVAGPAAASDSPPIPDDMAAALDRALAVEKQLVDALGKVRPVSVSVLIKKHRKDKSGAVVAGEPYLAGCGSGVVVFRGSPAKTWIVTNDHVASGADALEVVTSDGKVWPVDLVDTIAQYDIALLRFREKNAPVKGVPLVGKPSMDLNEGQWVLATGNPFFLALDGQCVSTLGVISGKERVLGSAQHLYGNAIQHDAPVNPGNSGGPLWNLKGELIGINGMIATRGGGGVGASSTGASFSIPIAQLEPYIKKLVDAKQDAQAGFLGLICETAKDEKGNPVGARVTQVSPMSPARGPSNNGIVVGDVIRSISWGGKLPNTILTGTDLLNALSMCPAGLQVTVKYLRGRSSHSWTGKLGDEK